MAAYRWKCFDENEDRPEKPRSYGVTEMRGPHYTLLSQNVLQDIFESVGQFVDGLKFAGGSHSLMPKSFIKEVTDVAHKHDIYVSTGDWAENLLRKGPSAFKEYVEECKSLGFDTIELNVGSLGIPEETLLRFVRLIKSGGLKAKPQFAVQINKSDIPIGDRAFGAYVVPRPRSSEFVEDVDLLIRRAERCLEAGADMIMIDADDVCKQADSMRADIIAKIIGRLGVEKTMFEASNPRTSEWFIKQYGPRMNLFVDHSQVMDLECLRGRSLVLTTSELRNLATERAMATQPISKKTACVIGGTGFVASLLVKLLLEKGYAVKTTVRDPDNQKKISHLTALQDLGELEILPADLTDEGSFDAPIAGCDLVFHVATPVNFASEDPENDMIKPAVQGVLNVLKACVKAKTVKRVVLTSSAAAVSINTLNGTGLVTDENDWSDVEFLSTAKPPTWGYPASKTLAEKTAWKFAEENNIDLITVIPSLMAGSSLTPDVPSSIGLAMSLITGNDFLINHALKGMQLLSGSISITHVEDVCRAHIFLAEKESASGRYICCAVNTSVPELAKFLNERYPEYKVPTEFGDFPSKAKLILSSEKLIKEGFDFKYNIEQIYDQAVDYFKAKGLLQN
ncbi:Hypothetical predicted protein [Prunus dulcis]|uniref:Bifunctional dihydroflavonol 4-reductase/flavanone 4-reductase n=2 Tax=Prunus dulcis TaxID=3755 RepID=A0A5E4FTD9_PRUDU|nr:Hypothetical predicted protein [Prunus dulcis]